MTSIPGTTLASSAFSSGTNTARRPMRRISMTIGIIPLTRLTPPASESSPAKAYSSSSSFLRRFVARRSATAMGRSYMGPSLRTSAGARLTVMAYSSFERKPEFLSAVDTRSFASFTAWSGRPTIANELVDFAELTSISTVDASTPLIAPE